MSTAVDIAKTEREARRWRQGKSTRASSKTLSLSDGIVTDTKAELEAFQKQMSRWQKFLSNEDEILFLEKIAKIVDDRLTELDDRHKGAAACWSWRSPTITGIKVVSDGALLAAPAPRY